LLNVARKIAQGTVLAAALVVVAGFGPPAGAAPPAGHPSDPGTLSGDALAAARAALNTEPRPVVTAQMRRLLLDKDAEATAYWTRKMAARSGATGARSLQSCPDGACDSNSVSANQTPQVNGYYCGPATLVEAVGHRGISISQYTAGDALGTTVDGTAWYDGSYPMADALNSYLSPQGARYAPTTLSWGPSSDEQHAFRTRLVSNIDHGWPIAGNALEVPGGPHLVGHPDVTIFHWFEIRGYGESGNTTWYEDSVHGADSIGWSGAVPAYSTYNTDALVMLMGGRGYVW
jgi:Peptidase_C39 like family